MPKPLPTGFSDEPQLSDGVAPTSGARPPGPIDGLGSFVPQGSVAERPFDTIQAVFDGFGSQPFTVGTDDYRLRRLTADWRPYPYEIEVRPEEALQVLERAATQYARSAAWRSLFQLAGSQLANLHEGGTFLLLRLRQHTATEKAVRQPPPPAPSRPPRASDPRPVEPLAMDPMQAQVLKDAAAQGIPFCEECAKAAAAQGGAA